MPSPACSRPNRPPNGSLACVRQYKPRTGCVTRRDRRTVGHTAVTVTAERLLVEDRIRHNTHIHVVKAVERELVFPEPYYRPRGRKQYRRSGVSNIATNAHPTAAATSSMTPGRGRGERSDEACRLRPTTVGNLLEGISGTGLVSVRSGITRNRMCGDSGSSSTAGRRPFRAHRSQIHERRDRRRRVSGYAPLTARRHDRTSAPGRCDRPLGGVSWNGPTVFVTAEKI